MTGFGDASREADGVHYAVEVRSLNNRYFKASIRLPEEIAGLEAELETRLRSHVHRGSITLTVKAKVSDAAAAHRINEDALISYLDHLEKIHQRVGDRSVHIDLTALVQLPGVLMPADDDQTMLNRARPALLELTDQACDRLNSMRDVEGGKISDDLATHLEVIRGALDTILGRAPQVIEEYHQRLRSRMDDLMARAELTVGEAELIKEVAVFAERADISEEVARLGSHLDQFKRVETETDGEPAGRTLEFLTQELLREANTIASKSNDAEISRAIVEVKGEIDRLKEQVQNIE